MPSSSFNLLRALAAVLVGATISIAALAAPPRQPPKADPGDGRPVLVPLEEVKFDSSRYRATPAEEKEILALIQALASIEHPDYGMAPWMSGSQFAPVPSSARFGGGIIMTDHGLKTDPSLERLVEFGPKAIPFLLEAIDDATATKLVLRHDGSAGGQWYGRELPINAASPREQSAVQQFEKFFSSDKTLRDEVVHVHVLTRGDACFVALGQIVNRAYSAARYQPTSCRVINSPSHDKAMTKVLRSMWSSNDPAAALFESLMTDLRTRGGDDEIVAGAALRLTFYFPDETAPMLATRLEAVRKAFAGASSAQRWEIKHREALEPVELIDAMSFTRNATIRKAVLAALAATDDPDEIRACITPVTAQADPDVVVAKTKRLFATPLESSWTVGRARQQALRAILVALPNRAKPIVEEQIAPPTSLRERLVILQALKDLNPVPAWASESLAPLLDDSLETPWHYGEGKEAKSIRVCDAAASLIAPLVKDARFVFEGDHAFLDAQIAVLKRRLAGFEVAAKDIPVLSKAVADVVQDLAPVAKATVAGSIARVLEPTDATSFWIATCAGTTDEGWHLDVSQLDAATGESRSAYRLNGVNATAIHRSGSPNELLVDESDDTVAVIDVRNGTRVGRIDVNDVERNDDERRRGSIGRIAGAGDGSVIAFIGHSGWVWTVDRSSAARKRLWQMPRRPQLPADWTLAVELIPLAGTTRAIVESVHAEVTPLLDLKTGSVKLLEGMPHSGWKKGWGRYAFNQLNDWNQLWNLDTGKRVELPLPKNTDIDALVLNRDQTIAFVRATDGTCLVVDLKTLSTLARLEPPATTATRFELALVGDERWLAWLADETKVDDESGVTSTNRTQVALFAVDRFKK